jgi:hypothetical protein
MLKKIPLLVVVGGGLLVGCTASSLAPPAVDAASKKVTDMYDSTTQRDGRSGSARITGAPIISTQLVQRRPASSVPRALGERRLTFSPDRPVSLFEVCDHIADFAGIGCNVKDQPAAGLTLAGGGSMAGTEAVTPGNAQAAFQASLGGGAVAGPNTRMVTYTGTFDRFLEYIKATFDTSLTVQPDGGIEFSSYEFSKYYVPAAPFQQTISSQVSGATAGAAKGPTGSTAAQNATSTSTLDPWKEVEATLKKLVPAPNVYTLNPAIRHVYVLARPSVKESVDRYFAELSNFLETRLAIEATLVEVRVTDTDDFGMNLAPVLRAGQISASFVGAAPSLAGTVGAGSIAVIPASGGGSSHWASTSATIKALASESRVSRVTHANQFVQNGRPAEMVLTTAQDILKNLGLSTVAQAGVATQQTQTETIDYGDTFQVAASAGAGSRIQLHYSVNSTSLADIVDKPVGDGASVQLTTLPRRLFELDIPVHNGETIVLAGQEQEVARRNRSGSGNVALCIPFGCTNNANVERTRLLLFVTATRVMDPHEMVTVR